jgi:hypothetical protein
MEYYDTIYGCRRGNPDRGGANINQETVNSENIKKQSQGDGIDGGTRTGEGGVWNPIITLSVFKTHPRER